MRTRAWFGSSVELVTGVIGTPAASVSVNVTTTWPAASIVTAVIAVSSPAPGVPLGNVVVVVAPGMVVLGLDGVVPPAAAGRQTNWYLSLSVPFVVFALALTFAVPFTNSPFLSGPPIGTTRSTGGEHVDALDG